MISLLQQLQHALLHQLARLDEQVGVRFALLQVDLLQKWRLHQRLLLLGQAAEIVEERLGGKVALFCLILQGLGDAVNLLLHGLDQLERGLVAVASSLVSLQLQHSQPIFVLFRAPLLLGRNGVR